MMEACLQHENYSLRHQLESLLHEARENERKMRRFDMLERQLIGARSLVDLIRLLLTDYKHAFGLEFVTLALVDREYEAARILETDNDVATAFPGLLLMQSPALLAEVHSGAQLPKLAPFDNRRHGSLFNAPPGRIASVALLPLVRQGELIGSLHLGSANPARYTDSVGTEFLERLANIIAICLESALTQERLKLVGLTDGLTGVQNRRYFEHRCQIELAQTRRHKQPLACMFLDIDKFKRINDVHGHQTGDEVLRGVARIIQSQLRTSDTIARYGGEEFVVLLPQTAGQYALEIAERIRLAIAEGHFQSTDGHSVPTTISIGLAMLQPDEAALGVSLDNLVARADKALYEAKHSGRNRVVSDGVACPRSTPWSKAKRRWDALCRQVGQWLPARAAGMLSSSRTRGSM
jgi:two-component system, cell cycle response regulator